MRIANTEDRRLKRLLQKRISHHKRNKNERDIENTISELKLLCSQCAFTPRFSDPDQKQGTFADPETKALRSLARYRLVEYEGNLKSDIETWRIALIHSKIAYVRGYLQDLESRFQWQKIHRIDHIPTPLENLGKMGMAYEAIRKRLIGLISHSADKMKTSMIGREDLIQEGEILLIECYRLKGAELGFISFSSYFKCSLWRKFSNLRMLEMRQNQTQKKVAKLIKNETKTRGIRK